MLRALIIWLSKANWAKNIITNWGPARRFSRRFVAGETLVEAVAAVRQLNQNGIYASLDLLGENTSNLEEAASAREQILEMLSAIAAARVQANISIKLTQIGLALDIEQCQQNLMQILEKARAAGIFVRLDMEDSPFTSMTLETYKAMRQAGYDNVGVVIQAYLYRSKADLDDLCRLQTRVRLCKGAYKESSRVAFPQKQEVDENYDRLAVYLLEQAQSTGLRGSADGLVPPLAAFASHDERRIQNVKNWLQQTPLPAGTVEFQMLYGIRRDLQADLVREGFPVRVYVPLGTHWYPYLMRRMAERPANLWFFAKNFFKS